MQIYILNIISRFSDGLYIFLGNKSFLWENVWKHVKSGNNMEIFSKFWTCPAKMERHAKGYHTRPTTNKEFMSNKQANKEGYIPKVSSRFFSASWQIIYKFHVNKHDLQIVYSAQADKIDAGEFKSIFGDFLRENVVSPSYKRGTGMIVIECESTMGSC